MPIVEVPASPPVPETPLPKQINAKIAEEHQRNALVDSKVTPYAALLTHIEGSSWFVDYYSQVLGADDDVTPYQPTQSAIYQQYLLVKKFELKLQGSLSTSDDSNTSVMTVTGTAVIYPYLKPNKGDAFIADIGDGRVGQFTVDGITKQTILKETCYQITFTLVRYATDELIKAINRKVVKTAYFNRDYLVYGQNPILVGESVETAKFLQDYEQDLLAQWVGLFYSNEYHTWLVPGQTRPAYDPYVVKMMLAMYDINAHPTIRKVREINVDGLDRMKLPSLWDALLTLDKTRLYDIFTTAHLIPAATFNAHPYFDGVRYSGIGYVVGPATPTTNVDMDYTTERFYIGMPYTLLNDMQIDLASILFGNVLDGDVPPGDDPLPMDSLYLSTEVATIHPVTPDNGYVLTTAFYTRAAVGRSKFELMVDDFFQTGAVNHGVLFGFCESVRAWGRLEKFYYIPILLALLRIMQRRV